MRPAAKIQAGLEEAIDGRIGRYKRVLLAAVWLVIALGIYRCGVTVDFREGEKKEEREETRDAASGSAAAEELQGSPAEQEEPAFDTDIRVLIKTDGFQDIYHGELCFVGTEGLAVEQGESVTVYPAGQEYRLDGESLQTGEQVVVRPCGQGKIRCPSVVRSADCAYRGRMECYGTEAGLVLVNELPVEAYLYGVLPSEMPSSYPLEAQKAQAIGARTYAYFHKKSYAYPAWRAHVDDSTAFQVYMNIGETDTACQAVDETRGLVITYEGELIQSFYYSTSSGCNGGAAVWGQGNDADGFLTETGEAVFAENSAAGEERYRAYIDEGNPQDIEYLEPWYRWEYVKDLGEEGTQALLETLYQMYLEQPEKVRIRSALLRAEQLTQEQGIRDIRVLHREKSGLVTSLMIETEHFRVNVRTQHSIRRALARAGDTVIKKDGSAYQMGDILPSDYFYMEKIYDNNAGNGDTLEQVIIRGGGLGHGAGMSQNGAKCLAAQGLTASEILAYYYKGSIAPVEEVFSG
ncbi:MAG: SpoIID/LytB domain-containing protein [Roseburia sp.]|nr:SpoIID/LytB domain-containing protein [Roseburia sp.]